MQTFLPYPGFAHTAVVLDRRRLGKQRVEVVQILKAITGDSDGWKNHPACKMWLGHTEALVAYGVIMCLEWINRGYNDTTLPKIMSFSNPNNRVILPPWVGYPPFHRAHRSNLLRKAPEHYGPIFLEDDPNLPDDLEYLWPVIAEMSPSERKEIRESTRRWRKVNEMATYLRRYVTWPEEHSDE